jgi:putative toxin-antitoxin system antitoxin component (TIGR02293 family)
MSKYRSFPKASTRKDSPIEQEIHIHAMAVRIWGNEADAAEWLNQPHPELNGAAPASLLDTKAGMQVVEALLAALEFGFPSR